MKSILFVIFCVSLVGCKAAKLPNYFNKCKKSDPNLGECVAKSGNAVMSHLVDGLSQLRFPSHRPLRVSHLAVDVGDSLKLSLSDAEISGIDKIHIERVNVDLTKRTYEFYIKTKRMEMLGNYDISGRILILPIVGKGPINTTFTDMDIKYSFDFDIVEKDGKGYMVPKNTKFTYETPRVYFRLDNLFNGNEILGTEMNHFLDNNWREVNSEIGVRLGDVMGQILTDILKGFMAKVPFDDMFLHEQ